MRQSRLQQLVVRGFASEVTLFRRAVASPDQPVYVTVKPACRTQRLSFEQSFRRLDGHELLTCFIHERAR